MKWNEKAKKNKQTNENNAWLDNWFLDIVSIDNSNEK